MKIFVIGCGSIGKRHIKNLISIGFKDIIAYDIDPESLKEIKKTHGINITNDLEDFINKSDAVFICSPNHLHGYHIKKCIGKTNIFVEKPLCHSEQDLLMINELIQNHNKVFKVGYNLRYHPIINEIKSIIDNEIYGKIYSVNIEFGSYLPSWRPGIDYKQNYGANSKMGGGILLDDVHEINYAQYLFGSFENIVCSAIKISDLEIDCEDSVEIILKPIKYEHLVHIHMDYLQLSPTRQIKIIFQKGTLIADINNNRIMQFQEKWTNKSSEFDYNNTYIYEIKDFFDDIKTNNHSIDGYEIAKHDMKSIFSAKLSSKKGRAVNI